MRKGFVRKVNPLRPCGSLRTLRSSFSVYPSFTIIFKERNAINTMRKLMILFLSLIILSSCSNSKTEQDADLKKTFMPIFKGVWVLTEYIKKIEDTRSPLKSADKLRGVVTMIIGDKIQGDSLDVGVSWNNHEGSHFTLYFTTGIKQNNLKINLPDYDEKANFYELGYEVMNNDTSLFLYHYSNANKILDKKQFTKVYNGDQSDGDAGRGLQHIVNDKLFCGEYLLVNNPISKTTIQFKKNGFVTGLSDFKTYLIMTDFLGGPYSNLDEVIFNLYPGKMKSYAFQMSGNRVDLYETTEEESQGLLKRGKLKYSLVRK